MKQAKNRQSYCCIRAPELRKGKEMSQKEAFTLANEEYKKFNEKWKKNL